MHASSYTPNARDIEFVLFEQLGLESLVGQGAYAHVTADDVKMIVGAAVDFATDVVAPTNRASDAEGCHLKDGHVTVPSMFGDLWKQVCEQGWIGLVAPAEVGGQALPKVIGTVVDELIIASNPAFHTYVGLCRAAANLLLHHASDALKEAYVAKLISGEWQGTMCLTEAGAGSDVGASVTRATALPDGTYKIQGSKVFITCAEHVLTTNHVHLVLARLPDAPAGVKGLSLFLVPRFRLDADGNAGEFNDVRVSKVEEKMGIHASPTCVVNFGDNDNCIGWLVGELGQGIRCMFHMMNEERIVVGLQGQALASAMYFNALKYAQERIQGSDISEGKSITEKKVPIVLHPDVRRMLMTVRALAEGGRALLYYTSLALDISESSEDEATRNHHAGRVALLTPVCKAWASDAGVDACNIALQVYGGAGFIADYPAEQYVRDARIAPIYEGTNGIQSIDLLFRKVLSGGNIAVSLQKEIAAWIEANAGHAELGKEVEALAAAVKELGEVTAFVAGKARSDVKLVAQGATPYLTLFGNVVVGWLLLQQAVIASAKLADVPASGEARVKALESSESARFYAGKVETARFFTHQLLSQNRWKAAQIVTSDRSCLDVVF